MSERAIGWVRERILSLYLPRLTEGERNLARVLAEHHRDFGDPQGLKLSELHAEIGYTSRRIQQFRDGLAQKGVITYTSGLGRGNPTVYTLAIPADYCTPRKGETSVTFSPIPAEQKDEALITFSQKGEAHDTFFSPAARKGEMQDTFSEQKDEALITFIRKGEVGFTFSGLEDSEEPEKVKSAPPKGEIEQGEKVTPISPFPDEKMKPASPFGGTIGGRDALESDLETTESLQALSEPRARAEKRSNGGTKGNQNATKEHRKPFDLEEVTQELITEFAGRWGEAEVRERISYAMQHRKGGAGNNWTDKRLGLKRWLARDAVREDQDREAAPQRAAPRTTNNNSSNSSQNGGNSYARERERERAGHQQQQDGTAAGGGEFSYFRDRERPRPRQVAP